MISKNQTAQTPNTDPKMASLSRQILISMFLCYILFIHHTAKCDDDDHEKDDLHDNEIDEDDKLLQGINSFRATLNLSPLIEIEKAECLADKIADRFDSQPCVPSASGDAGAFTPASPQFSNYRGFLRECGLELTTTRAGIILPACVSNLVVSNDAMSQYSQYHKDPKYTGIGIGTEDNWVVIVLTTNTAEGSFISARSIGTVLSSQASEVGPTCSYLILLVTNLFLFLLHWTR